MASLTLNKLKLVTSNPKQFLKLVHYRELRKIPHVNSDKKQTDTQMHSANAFKATLESASQTGSSNISESGSNPNPFKKIRNAVDRISLEPIDSSSEYKNAVKFVKDANPFKTIGSTIDRSSSEYGSPSKFVFSTNPFNKTNSEVLNTVDQIPSPLEPVDLTNPPDDSASNFIPAFNFAAYINKSESLQQLIKLGVDLSQIEKRKGLPQFVLKLDFENDIKPYLMFLHDHGIHPDEMGKFLTKNPLIFKENLDNLQTRINYLEVKNFKKSQIQRIITKNPFWLMFSTRRIDKRLGSFQQNFKLTGDDIRFLATKQPRLITYNWQKLQESTFCIKEEMGFDEDEVKCLLLSKPRLWMIESDEIVERFHYVHNIMKIPHLNIVQSPEVLTSREFRIKQRHEFLKWLGKAQYDPSRDLYVSLKRLVEGTDQEFVINVAKADMKTYDTFLRTL